jgi:hypothetical protein
VQNQRLRQRNRLQTFILGKKLAKVIISFRVFLTFGCAASSLPLEVKFAETQERYLWRSGAEIYTPEEYSLYISALKIGACLSQYQILHNCSTKNNNSSRHHFFIDSPQVGLEIFSCQDKTYMNRRQKDTQKSRGECK